MAVPYNNGKVQIGKNYVEQFKPVVFTRDEEIIQDIPQAETPKATAPEAAPDKAAE